jgi:hypothetical protein
VSPAAISWAAHSNRSAARATAAALLAFQVGDRDGVGDLHHVGEQLGLLVGQLPGPGLRHLDQPGVGDVLPQYSVQGGGQLRPGRQGHHPVHEFHHSGHGSKLRSNSDIPGCIRGARGEFTRKAQRSVTNGEIPRQPACMKAEPTGGRGRTSAGWLGVDPASPHPGLRPLRSPAGSAAWDNVACRW